MVRWIRGHWRKAVMSTWWSTCTAGYRCRVVDIRKGSPLFCCLCRCSIDNLSATITGTTNYECLVASFSASDNTMASYERMVGCGQQSKACSNNTVKHKNKRKTIVQILKSLPSKEMEIPNRRWGKFLHCLHLVPFLLSLHEAIRAHAPSRFGCGYSIIPLFRYSVIPYSAFYSVPNLSVHARQGEGERNNNNNNKKIQVQKNHGDLK